MQTCIIKVWLHYGIKNRFFLYKNFNFWFIFSMVFNAIDSPDIISCSKQPKYVTLEYYFILIPLCIISSFPVFLNFCFERKSMHFVFSYLDEYFIYCLQNIHINWHRSYLFNVQLHEHLHVGMLNQNCQHIKTNRNEHPGAYH